MTLCMTLAEEMKTVFKAEEVEDDANAQDILISIYTDFAEALGMNSDESYKPMWLLAYHHEARQLEWERMNTSEIPKSSAQTRSSSLRGWEGANVSPYAARGFKCKACGTSDTKAYR